MTQNRLSAAEWYELEPDERWSKENVLAVLDDLEDLPKEISSPMLWCQQAPYEICFDDDIFWHRIHSGLECRDNDRDRDPQCWLEELPELFVNQLGYGIFIINFVCDYYTKKEPSTVRAVDLIVPVFTRFPRLRSDRAVWNHLIEGAASYGSHDMTKSDFCRCLKEWAPKEIILDKDIVRKLLYMAGTADFRICDCVNDLIERFPDLLKTDKDAVESLQTLVDACLLGIDQLSSSAIQMMPPAFVGRQYAKWHLPQQAWSLRTEDDPLNLEVYRNRGEYREFLREYIVHGGHFHMCDQYDLSVFPEEWLEFVANDSELLLLIAEHDRMHDIFSRVASGEMRSNKPFMLRAIEKAAWVASHACSR